MFCNKRRKEIKKERKKGGRNLKMHRKKEGKYEKEGLSQTRRSWKK